MSVEMRLAIPHVMPRPAAAIARRERWLGWFATGVTALVATIAILGVAASAVLLGLT